MNSYHTKRNERVIPRDSLDFDKGFFDKYNSDWLNKWKGDSSVVLFPDTVDQVSLTLKFCNEKKIAVVPQGGNTGLVGGSIPIYRYMQEVILYIFLMHSCIFLFIFVKIYVNHNYSEAILSLEKMDKIISFDEISGILVCPLLCYFILFSFLSVL